MQLFKFYERLGATEASDVNKFRHMRSFQSLSILYIFLFILYKKIKYLIGF